MRRSDDAASPLRERAGRVLDSLGPALYRGAAVRAWAEGRGVGLPSLEGGRFTGPLVQAAASREAAGAARILAPPGSDLSLKDLERCFELLAGPEGRRAHGVVYTPEPIVDYLVGEGLRMGARSRAAAPRVLDPSCGSGGFLLGAARALEERHGIGPERAFAEHIAGIDRDPEALARAGLLAELHLVSRGVKLPGPEPRLLAADTLVAPPRELAGALGFPGGFDLVATNPPYVKLQSLEPGYRRRLLAAYPEHTRGSFSLALLFLLAGHRLLAPGGILAYITQNNLYTSLAASPVRRYLEERRAIRRIVDFGPRHVFPGASAYTCLVFLGTTPRPSFEYASVAAAVTPQALAGARSSRVLHASLGGPKWRLGGRRERERLRRLEGRGVPLGSLVTIRVGFATLKDAVFLVRGRGSRCVARRPDGSLGPVERGITVPAVKVSELREPEDLTRGDRRVIRPYAPDPRRPGRFRLLEPAELRERYPLAWAHLEASRALLEARDRGRRSYPAWYAWGRTQGLEARGPKLLTKTFSGEPRFFLDRSDALYCNGYGLFPLERDGAPVPEALLRLLNSRVMADYMRLTSFRIEGDYPCYQKSFLTGFPVPELTGAEQDRLLALGGEEREAHIAGLYGLDLEELAPPAENA